MASVDQGFARGWTGQWLLRYPARVSMEVTNALVERRVDLSNLDLDRAAELIAARRPGWLSRGLTASALTYRDPATDTRTHM